jgi:hypothetical protein
MLESFQGYDKPLLPKLLLGSGYRARFYKQAVFIEFKLTHFPGSHSYK